MNLSVDGRRRILLRDGSPWFYLADTVWSAFTNPTDREWEEFLRLRREQGFAALQINVLPQWDRSILAHEPSSYRRLSTGRYEWSQPRAEYWERARARCASARDAGFVLALVGLWANYVPNTWASGIQDRDVMPFAQVRPYGEFLHETFAEYDPIWVVGGDTDIAHADTSAYYVELSDVLRARSAHLLQTIHMRRADTGIPDALADRLDFLMYQSGHNPTAQEAAYEIPAELSRRFEGKPIINAEPCYEHMGFSRRAYGRFSRADVRRAGWTSVLAGAHAGLTYGAHGVWNWHRFGATVDPALGEGFDEALPATRALGLPGAWDYGVLRERIEPLLGAALTPRADLLVNADPAIACASAGDEMLIYLPTATHVTVSSDLTGCRVRAVSLATGQIAHPEVRVSEGRSTIRMVSLTGDLLLSVRMRNPATPPLSAADSS